MFLTTKYLEEMFQLTPQPLKLSKIICLLKTAKHPTQSNKSMTLLQSVLRIVSKISDLLSASSITYYIIY